MWHKSYIHSNSCGADRKRNCLLLQRIKLLIWPQQRLPQAALLISNHYLEKTCICITAMKFYSLWFCGSYCFMIVIFFFFFLGFRIYKNPQVFAEQCSTLTFYKHKDKVLCFSPAMCLYQIIMRKLFHLGIKHQSNVSDHLRKLNIFKQSQDLRCLILYCSAQKHTTSQELWEEQLPTQTPFKSPPVLMHLF